VCAGPLSHLRRRHGRVRQQRRRRRRWWWKLAAACDVAVGVHPLAGLASLSSSSSSCALASRSLLPTLISHPRSCILVSVRSCSAALVRARAAPVHACSPYVPVTVRLCLCYPRCACTPAPAVVVCTTCQYINVNNLAYLPCLCTFTVY
jgi:hypothetical protein